MEPGEKVLIIDDDGVLRLALKAFLEGLGLRAEEASAGLEGLACIRRERPALVLLDLTMPGMGGMEVCEEIRAMPGGDDIPVIIMSGLLGTTQKVKAFHAGAVDCISKPIQYEALEIRVRTHLAIRCQKIALAKALHDAGAMNKNLLALNGKLQHSEEVKTRFMGIMRNYINNPLNDILGLAAGIAQEGMTLGKARDLAALIKDNAFRMDCQIRNVFMAAELEAGDARPCIARVDLESVARDVLESFQPYAKTKGLALELLIQGEPGAFPADGDKLHHILVNLVSNAVQFAGEGTVRLTLDAGPSLSITVEDQGPGILEPEQKAVFEPFRANAGSATGPRGHGLGLPVVKAMVDILGGELHLDSEPGRGAAFRITLPRASMLDELGADAMDGNILFFDEPHEF